MSDTESHKAVVRRCFEIASRGDLGALETIVDPEYVLHGGPGPDEVRGLAGLSAMVEGYRSALADLRVTVEHQLAEDDFVATRVTVEGRHEGELMGVPPTGRPVAFACLVISRIQGGRIAEEWEHADVPGLLGQIGALPAAA